MIALLLIWYISVFVLVVAGVAYAAGKIFKF